MKRLSKNSKKSNCSDLRALNDLAEPSPCHDAPPEPFQVMPLAQSQRTSDVASHYLKADHALMSSSAVDSEVQAAARENEKATSSFPKRLTRDSRSRSARRA